MRLPSAFVVLTVAALAAGCSIPVAPSPKPDPAIASLKDLGVEGKTYVSDLGADRPFRVNRVFTFGDDVMLEDLAGGLLFLDGKTLQPRWAYYGLPRPFDSAPDATDSVVTGVSQGKMFVLSRKNGLEEIPPAPIDVVPSAGAVTNDTTAYVPTFRTPSGNKTVQSVNLADGFKGWGFRTSEDVVVDLEKAGLHGGDMLYAASADGMLHGIPMYVATAREAEPAWSVNVRSGLHRALTVSGDDLGVVPDDHRLICIDRITGGTRWEVYPGSGEKASTSAQFSSKHAFYVCGGEFRAYDRATGAKAWSVKGPAQFVGERGKRTIVTDGKGTLWAVETATGKVLGTRSMPGWNFPARATPDATIVAVSNAGVIVAVEMGW
jgi:outer membrane protein assembly factor BamB